MKDELSSISVSAYITKCADLEKNLYTLKRRKETLIYTRENIDPAKNKQTKHLPAAAEKEATKYSYIAIIGTVLIILLSFFKDKITALNSSPTLPAAIIWMGLCLAFYYLILKKKWDKMTAEAEAADACGEGSEKETENAVISAIDRWISDTDKLISDTEDVLSKLYGMEILAPEYRSLVPVVMIDGFLKEGRCTELNGSEGACAAYENDLSGGRITDDLALLCQIANGEDPDNTQYQDVLNNQEKLLNFIYSGDKIASTNSPDGSAKLIDYSRQLIEDGIKMSDELA